MALTKELIDKVEAHFYDAIYNMPPGALGLIVLCYKDRRGGMKTLMSLSAESMNSVTVVDGILKFVFRGQEYTADGSMIGDLVVYSMDDSTTNGAHMRHTGLAAFMEDGRTLVFDPHAGLLNQPLYDEVRISNVPREDEDLYD